MKKTRTAERKDTKNKKTAGTLRIMGSQNWWFEDPKEPCYTGSNPSLLEGPSWFLGQVVCAVFLFFFLRVGYWIRAGTSPAKAVAKMNTFEICNANFHHETPKTQQSGEQNATWLVVSTHLKNISQNGNLPQIGVKIKNVWVATT